MKGCQIASFRMDSQARECVTQEYTRLRFDDQKSTCTDLILAVKSSFLASLQDAFTKAILFRGFPLRCNPPATLWDRFAIKIIGRLKQLVPRRPQTSRFQRQISLPALRGTLRIRSRSNAIAHPTEFISVETGLYPTPAVHHQSVVQKPVSLEASSMGTEGLSITSNFEFLTSR